MHMVVEEMEVLMEEAEEFFVIHMELVVHTEEMEEMVLLTQRMGQIQCLIRQFFLIVEDMEKLEILIQAEVEDLVVMVDLEWEVEVEDMVVMEEQQMEAVVADMEKVQMVECNVAEAVGGSHLEEPVMEAEVDMEMAEMEQILQV